MSWCNFITTSHDMLSSTSYTRKVNSWSSHFMNSPILMSSSSPLLLYCLPFLPGKSPFTKTFQPPFTFFSCSFIFASHHSAHRIVIFVPMRPYARKPLRPFFFFFLSRPLECACGNNDCNGLQLSRGSCEWHYDCGAITKSMKTVCQSS